MPVDVTVEVIIDRPRDAVTAYAMNPENDPIWITGIQTARMLTEPPLSIGTRVERLASFLGKRIEYVLEVVEHDGQHLARHALGQRAVPDEGQVRVRGC